MKQQMEWTDFGVSMTNAANEAGEHLTSLQWPRKNGMPASRRSQTDSCRDVPNTPKTDWDGDQVSPCGVAGLGFCETATRPDESGCTQTTAQNKAVEAKETSEEAISRRRRRRKGPTNLPALRFVGEPHELRRDRVPFAQQLPQRVHICTTPNVVHE